MIKLNSFTMKEQTTKEKIKEAIVYLYEIYRPTGNEGGGCYKNFSDNERLVKSFYLIYNILSHNILEISENKYNKHVTAFVELINEDKTYVDKLINIIRRMKVTSHSVTRGYQYLDLLWIKNMDEFIAKVNERFSDDNLEKYWNKTFTVDDFMSYREKLPDENN